MNGLLDKMKQFISTRGLGEAFAEFVKSLEPKTMKERLAEKQKVVKEQTQQKSMHTQDHGTSRKHYLKEHRSGIYQAMLLNGKLKEHLLMMQEQAETQFDLLVKQMKDM